MQGGRGVATSLDCREKLLRLLVLPQQCLVVHLCEPLGPLLGGNICKCISLMDE